MSEGGECTYRLVFDAIDKRPYCVLLQAAYGGDPRPVSAFFDTAVWHLSPTANPVAVEGTEEQLRAHDKRLRAAKR